MNREMKDSGSQWIQDIPNKWNNERLKYTITARDGGAWGEEPTKDNPGVICMRIADFNYDDGVFQDKPQEQLTKRLYTNNQINRLMLMQNDICIEKSGGGEKTPVGRTVIFDKAYPALFANFMERLRFNPNIIIPHFGEYWFRAMYSCKVSPVYIKQTTGIQNLDVGTMLAVERIYYPSLPEQRQIVHFLDRKCAAIDTAIEKTKESIEKLEEYKKAVITKAVTKGLDPDVKMKDSGVEWIGEIPEDWDIRRIKTVGTYRNGLTYSPDDLTDETNGTLVLRSSNIKDGKLVLQDNLYVRTHISDKLRVQKGDILICSRNGSRALIGKNALIDSDMDASFGAFMMIYRSKDPYYIHWVLKSEMMSYYLASFTTSTINQLIGSDFGNMYLPWPLNIQERQQISNYLNNKCSSIDALVTRKQETINKLEEYKKSLIYYAVTGKIDCRSEVV